MKPSFSSFAWSLPLTLLAGVLILATWASVSPFIIFAIVLVAIAGSISLAIRLIGSSLLSLRPASVPFEIIPPAPRLNRYASEVAEASRPVEEVSVAGQEESFEESRAWRQETIKFAIVGNSKGFSLRAMAGHVTRPSWETYTGLLVDACILRTGKAGTRWAEGWGVGRLGAELRNEVLALPFPAGDPPAVKWVLNGKAYTAHTTQHSNTPNTGGGDRQLNRNVV